MSNPTVTKAGLDRFNDLRREAAKLMQEAALQPVPDHWRAQARAAATLCNTRLHRIVGEADAIDARQIADDGEHIAKHIADPLWEAIGRHAADNFHGVDIKLFQGQMFSAIDGNALYVLHKVADEIVESHRDDAAEMQRDFQRTE